MCPEHTRIHHELIPKTVGSVELPYHLQTPLPVGLSATQLMDDFREEMHPSRGEPSLNSRFGGLYLGRYYEVLIQESNTEVWAHNEQTTKDINDILLQIVERSTKK